MNNHQIRQIIEKCLNENRILLTEYESKLFFKEAGIEVIDTWLTQNREEAMNLSEQIGFPVVLKIISPDIIHKSDIGGIRLSLKTAEEVGMAFDDILTVVKQRHPNAKIHGISVQRMASPGTEIIIGMFKDQQFGPVLMFGLGGIFVEVLKDVSFGIIPLTKRDAREMVKGIKGYPIFEGYRGMEKIDISILEALLLKISNFVETYKDIKEFDLNPIFCYKNSYLVVDARVILDNKA